MKQSTVKALWVLGGMMALALGCATVLPHLKTATEVTQKVGLVCSMATNLFPELEPVKQVCGGFWQVQKGLAGDTREALGESTCDAIAEIVTKQETPEANPEDLSPTAEKILECAEDGQDCANDLR